MSNATLGDGDGFNIFVDDHSVPLYIFLHLPNYRTQEICKIIPTNLVLAASDLRPRMWYWTRWNCLDQIKHSKRPPWSIMI